MKIMNQLTIAAAVLILALPAAGQRTSPSVLDPVAGRTAEDLVARALAQNGEILAGGRQVVAARGGVTQAGLKANPSVAFTESQEAAGGQNTFIIGGSLPLELYHRRERRIEVAQSGVKMTEFDQAERERRLRAEVEMKFGEVLASAALGLGLWELGWIRLRVRRLQHLLRQRFAGPTAGATNHPHRAHA